MMVGVVCLIPYVGGASNKKAQKTFCAHCCVAFYEFFACSRTASYATMPWSCSTWRNASFEFNLAEVGVDRLQEVEEFGRSL